MRFLFFLLALAGNIALSAQIRLALDYLPTTERYRVSLVAEETIAPPHNLIGTFQTTLIAKAGTLELVAFENLVEGVVFMPNSIVESPGAAPQWDYFSVGMNTLTSAIPLQAGVVVPLFSFANARDCTAPVALLDMTTDPLYLDPNKVINVGHHLSLPMRLADNAFAGIDGSGQADCRDEPTGTTVTRTVGQARTYPNPVTTAVHVELTTPAALTGATLELLDAQGRSVGHTAVDQAAGTRTYTLPTAALAAGLYRCVVRTGDTRVEVGHVVKAE